MPIANVNPKRILSPVRKWGWLFILIVAIGGLWYPKLGLLMIPVMIALMLISFFAGKFWCGNLCPHGSLFDSIFFPISPNKRIGGFFKSKITVIIAFTAFMGMIMIRVSQVFKQWGAFDFYDKLGMIFVTNYLVVTIIGSALALLIASRTWCSICPMGTMQILMYKLGKITKLNQKTDRRIFIANRSKCYQCAKCAKVCPMQLQPYREFSQENSFDNEDCIRCTRCVDHCPSGILSLR